MFPKSIVLRLFISECLVLSAFFSLVIFSFEAVLIDGVTKNRLMQFMVSLQEDAKNSVRKIRKPDDLKMPVYFKEGRFGDPYANLYAYIYHDGKKLWQSPSLGKQELNLALVENVKGQDLLERDKAGYDILYMPVVLASADNEASDYLLIVFQSTFFTKEQVETLEETFVEWMVYLGLILIGIRLMVLRAGLRPLQNIASDLKAVDAGEKNLLDGDYPSELQGLVSALNANIAHGRVRIEHHRRDLADLAHKLKTPLAILRGCTENFSANKGTIEEQISRMDAMIRQQLHQATVSAELPVIKQVDLAALIHKMQSSLGKVYLERHIHFDINVPEQCPINCDESHLYEVVGNLMDNACKWCKSTVKVSITLNPRRGRHNFSVLMQIEDDGPGIPLGKFNEILKWGVRADENIHGHGIGVSVVNEIITTLGGKLDGGKKTPLGGMRWDVYFP